MSERKQLIADAAVKVIAAVGLRGLTYKAVDEEANLPAGSTSNCFRTRTELIDGVVTRMADTELCDLASATDSASAAAAFNRWSDQGLAQTLARFELMIEAVRSPGVATVLNRQRARFTSLAEHSEIIEPTGFTGGELTAILAGMQFAEITTGEKVLHKVLALLQAGPIKSDSLRSTAGGSHQDPIDNLDEAADIERAQR
ncbi:hypothetical protein [Rhodococcus sp. H29-C3]|uniref:TetR/AcrR family transcriptional regulator n=1 Tax=Rhodococcus sp. H29-C3 TaxID=3046307 RepID=UPI0024B99CC3|nr:hypothetical protein [Rhodococcus sp. H29-C3]MDJ0363111.1 hypothetical protein [Rhodococcus sp. H29-C3]